MLKLKNNILVFDIWADYGHFKKPYTTTSPLTYSMPSCTALAGMVSAIIGLDKREYSSFFGNGMAGFGISLLRPVKKVRISENLINTKKSMNRIYERTQIKFEFLKDPSYRIYFRHSDEDIYSALKAMLEKHKSVYTLSMGLSQLLANYGFVGEYESVDIEGSREFKEFACALPAGLLGRGDVNFRNDGEYFTERLPLEMNNDRLVKSYGDVLFERCCGRIAARLGKYIDIKGLEESISLILDGGK